MGKADVWASFGTGLVMTALSIVLGAKWLLVVAAICYAVALVLYLRQRRKGATMDDKKKPDVVGFDIENEGAGTGAEITSQGTPDAPSFGGQSIAIGMPGQTVVVTRVVQRGPGVGMRVTQVGPGVGFRSIAVAGTPPEKKEKNED